jgi:hypothetical protein
MHLPVFGSLRSGTQRWSVCGAGARAIRARNGLGPPGFVRLAARSKRWRVCAPRPPLVPGRHQRHGNCIGSLMTNRSLRLCSLPLSLSLSLSVAIFAAGCLQRDDAGPAEVAESNLSRSEHLASCFEGRGLRVDEQTWLGWPQTRYVKLSAPDLVNRQVLNVVISGKNDAKNVSFTWRVAAAARGTEWHRRPDPNDSADSDAQTLDIALTSTVAGFTVAVALRHGGRTFYGECSKFSPLSTPG